MATPLDAASATRDERREEQSQATLFDAYEVETARHVRSRLDLTMALYLVFLGITTFFERRMPGRGSVVVAYGFQTFFCLAAVLLVRVPRLERVAKQIALGATAGLSLTMLGYGASIHSAWDAVVIGQVCLMTCLAILLPWGWRAQLALSAISLGGFAAVTPLLDPPASTLYSAIGLLTAATTSSVAAFLLDRYRFQAFAQASELSRAYALQQEEAAISGVLLYVAQTLGEFIGRADLLDQVNRLAIEALGCDWSSTFVFDHESNVFRFVSNVGSPDEIRNELESIAMPPGAMPLFAELEHDRMVEITDPTQQTLVPQWLLERWQVASMLCAPIYRSERLIGALASGYVERRGPFSRKQRRLILGIGHAVAAGVDNERLIRDLRAANRLKSDFVATMSHELRTPLNVILGYAEMLADAAQESPQEVERFAQRIHGSATELLDLVNATLDLGRMESGRDVLHVEPVLLGAVLSEIEREVGALAHARGLQLSWQCEIDRRPIVTDRVKLKTIVKNLVGNAIKYTETGSVTVLAERERDALVLRVRDTGVGIAAADLPAIFEMFQQVDSSTTRAVGGVGLGLYIVRQLVDRLGGEIEVDSTPGRGSTFSVRLPAPDSGVAACDDRDLVQTHAG